MDLLGEAGKCSVALGEKNFNRGDAMMIEGTELIPESDALGGTCNVINKTCERIKCFKTWGEPAWTCMYQKYPFGKLRGAENFGKFSVFKRERDLLVTPIENVSIAGQFTAQPLPTIPSPVPRLPSRGIPSAQPKAYSDADANTFCRRESLKIASGVFGIARPSITSPLSDVCFNTVERMIGKQRDLLVEREAIDNMKQEAIKLKQEEESRT